ncbi:hypothetical protein OAG71_05215, partial [bacterium]|nr:hypothetical protein [bacterium]
TGVENTHDGILSNYKKKNLSRKASLSALKIQYDGQLDVLRHQIGQACRVEKSRADVHAEQYLKELDAKHLEVLSELGLRNKETREEALLKLTDSTVERLKEVQAKDWPPSLIDETISELFKLRSRAVAEIMNELGGQPEDA